MKKRFITIITTIALSLISAIPVFAAGWVQDSIGWRYIVNDETNECYTKEWQWIDDGTGIARCYCFDYDGYLYTDCQALGLRDVDANGAWILDGVVQTRKIGQEITPDEISNNLSMWIGKYVAKDGQSIIIKNVNEDNIHLTFCGYGEEGWYTADYIADFLDDEKLEARCCIFNVGGEEFEPDIYSITMDGGAISVLSSSFKVGTYYRQ